MSSSIMQPLPLASRHAGAAGKHESLQAPSSALGSTWIRRFLPASDHVCEGELGPEGDYMLIDCQPSNCGRMDSGSHPAPLLLQHTGNSVQHEREREGGVARFTTGVGSGNGDTETQDTGVRPEMTTAVLDVGVNVVQNMDRMATNLMSQEGNFASYGRVQVEGYQVEMGSTRGESQVYCQNEQVTGFGSLRVLRKPVLRDCMKVSQRRTNSKMKAAGMERGIDTEADVPAEKFRMIQKSNARVPDIRLTGTHDSEYGTKCTALPMSTLLKESSLWGESRRPSRTVELSGPRGFLMTKRKGVHSDNSKPSMSRPDRATLTAPRFSQGLEEKESELIAISKPFSEDALIQRCTWWYREGLDNSFIDGRPNFESKDLEESFVPTFSQVSLGIKEGEDDGGQCRESKPYRYALEGATVKRISDENLHHGLENLKTKELVECGYFGKRLADGGPSQRWSGVVSPFAPHRFQGETLIGKVGQPLPFAPHISFPDDAGPNISREDIRNCRGGAQHSISFVAPQQREGGLDGLTRRIDRMTAWRSPFAAFNGPKDATPPTAASSPVALSPPDRHSRLDDKSTPANRPTQGPEVGRNQGKSWGVKSGKQEANFCSGSSFGEGRSYFDNPSSHLSSSPWPENESLHPNDDAGSGPCSSQETGSGFYSQASRVANRTTIGSHGQYVGTHRHGDVRQLQITSERNQAHWSSQSARHLSSLFMSGGQKDDTSASSPPSRPSGYNSSSDLGSPVLPMSVVDKQLLNGAVHAGYEVEGDSLKQWQVGGDNASNRIDFIIPRHDSEGRHKDLQHATGLPGKDLAAEMVQPTSWDVYCKGGAKFGRLGKGGLKHGKLRMECDAIGEVGSLGPSKRPRHNPNLDSKKLASKTNTSRLHSVYLPVGESEKPSMWLQRWLLPTNPTKHHGRPEEGGGIGFSPGSLIFGGQKNFASLSGKKSMQVAAPAPWWRRIDEEVGPKTRNGVKIVATKRGVYGLPPFPTPSAAAMALVGTAARKVGPFPQQRRGSLFKWPSVHFKTPQVPDANRTLQSVEPRFIKRS